MSKVCYAICMRQKAWIRIVNFILAASLTAVAVNSGASKILTVEATNISTIEEEIRRRQEELEAIYGQITDLEAEQDLILEQLEDLNAEIINTMASISLKEDEIAAKKDEIAAKENEIEQKQEQIVQTAAEYEAAKEREETQRQDMAARTRMLYEQGNDSYINALLGANGLADILNRMDYIEKIYEYSKLKLDGYIEVKDELHDLWNLLEEEKAGLELDYQQLEIDRNNLETQESELRSQESRLKVMLDEKKRQSNNYEAEIDKARQEAAVAKTLLKQDQERLKQLQAQAQAQAQAQSQTQSQSQSQPQQPEGNSNAGTTAPGNYSSDYDFIIDSSAGSDLGRQIAKFACQYIGNPYVAGGTSLTNGADCSGFTYSVYAAFGYSIPRTSYLQRSAGTGVSYESAQVGDLICYDGHVALYIGGGLVVHASNSNPSPRGGIKVSNANYRTILAVRRIL